MAKDKDLVNDAFADAPLDNFTLKRIVEIASEPATSMSPVEKLAAMAVEFLRTAAVEELKRRGVIGPKGEYVK